MRFTSIAENLRCRVCASTELEKRGAKRGRFIDAEFSFYQCCECRFLFVEPVTDFAIYNDAYYAGKGPEPLVNYEDEYSNYAATARRFEFQNLIDFAEKHLANANLVQIF